MVKLSFTLKVNSPLEPIWQYFSNFEVIEQWDPNVRKSTLIKKTPQKLGSIYQLITVFNENQSIVNYHMFQYEQQHKIALRGENNIIVAIDQIIFLQKGTHTQIQYRADISLKCPYWLFTCCVRGGLDKLTEEAKRGMIKKCEQKFGRTQG